MIYRVVGVVMKPFRVCPRCDKWSIFKRSVCYECDFRVPDYLDGLTDWIYKFPTDRYYVWAKTGGSRVEKAKTGGSRVVNWWVFPVTDVYIPKQLSPKTTDADIERLLLLL